MKSSAAVFTDADTGSCICLDRSTQVLFSQRQKVVLTLAIRTELLSAASNVYVLLRLRLLSAFARTAPHSVALLDTELDYQSPRGWRLYYHGGRYAIRFETGK